MTTTEYIPSHWEAVELGAINVYKSANINPANFPNEVFELYSVPIFPTGKPELVAGKDIGSTKQFVKPGDVLLCKINPRINRVWKVNQIGEYRQIASSEWIVVRQPNFDARFLRYFFSHPSFRSLLCSDVSGVGGSLTRARPKIVTTYKVPAAPLPEQKQIAATLDQLLARVEAIKTRLDAIPALLKRFRQSVLAAAVSGRLTEEWRKNNSLSEPVLTLVDDFVSLVTKGASPKWQGINYVEDPLQTLFVTSENIGTMELLLSSPKYVQDEFNE